MADPRATTTKAGITRVSFSIVVDSYIRHQDGSGSVEGTFFNIAAFGATADNVVKFVTKRTHIMVTAVPRTHKYYSDSKGCEMTEMNFVLTDFTIVKDAKPVDTIDEEDYTGGAL